MSKDIKVVEIEEHEDGSATLQVECSPETFSEIFNYGFVELVRNGMEATMVDNKPKIKPMTDEERQRATYRAMQNQYG